MCKALKQIIINDFISEIILYLTSGFTVSTATITVVILTVVIGRYTLSKLLGPQALFMI